MAFKVAIVLLADVGSAGDMGRMANALVTAQECHQAGDQVKLIFRRGRDQVDSRTVKPSAQVPFPLHVGSRNHRRRMPVLCRRV